MLDQSIDFVQVACNGALAYALFRLMVFANKHGNALLCKLKRKAVCTYRRFNV